ncbi:RICIN domain-containing protein [Streptomyces sp. NPDC089919]|uniref:RICIN domain-containing protein n=1 Tax=Streptomyces sp. NPDC089919 TaxID=3155188 RepID=UPI003416EBBE
MLTRSSRTAGVLAAAVAAVAGTMASTPAAPASAAPATVATDLPALTVSIGRKGPWGNPDDSPAAPFIARDGSFHYQSAHALYGKTDPREWKFWSGRNFDTAKPDTKLNGSVNPANSADRNSDTTWRCNNSPTGLTATFPPAGSSYSQKNFCDLMGVWVDPDSGDWYGLVHNEFTPSPFGDGLHYDAIDYAVSKDQGRTWTIKDHVLTSPYSTRRGDSAAFPHETYYYGDGDPRLFVDTASGYFYVYYNSRAIPKPGSPGGWTDASQAHVARAPMSGKMAPSSWRKWYDGSWSQPGVGGKESNMLPVDSADDTGYTPVEHDYDPQTPGSVPEQQAAGELPSKADLLTMNIAWDAYLGLYIGTPEAVHQDSTEPQRFYATDNLATQKWRLIGDSGDYRTGSWYRWFLDRESRTSSQTVGRTFRNYCSFQCSGGADGEYYEATIDTTAPAMPVPAGGAYTITGAGGRVLAQTAGAATTSLAANTPASRATWVFRPTGDGAYTLTNAATRGLLGVDSTRDVGRAWGAKPTVTTVRAGGPTVGQQWWVIPGRRADGTPDGTVHLINRYSGLALGLSAHQDRPAETTPARAWSDTARTPVGDGRTAAEQAITLQPAGSRRS